MRPLEPESGAGGPSGEQHPENAEDSESAEDAGERSAGAPADSNGLPAVSTSPRAEAIKALSGFVGTLAAAGDLAAARVLERALADLLNDPRPEGGAAEVIDLHDRAWRRR